MAEKDQNIKHLLSFEMAMVVAILVAFASYSIRQEPRRTLLQFFSDTPVRPLCKR